ncbi:MAG: TonB-dependent receptor [Bacteroidota bacterium]|nr:TonB-dependent receptor [Bacteroidota bacterium]
MTTYIRLLFFNAFSCLCFALHAQSNFGVNVYSFSNGRGYESLPYADIKDVNGKIITQSDSSGLAQWSGNADKQEIVVSALGYASDTLDLVHDEYAKVILYPEALESTVIQSRRNSRQLGVTLNTTLLDQKDLTKAACCNLSESFETNNSVDVGYTDAITGSKKLHMLGLDGKYAEIRFEGLSSIRGLNLLGGMIDVPGPFLYSIALSKGSGSIVTGREAISGQIVYNWKPPDCDERLHINVYLGAHGRLEGNILSTEKISRRWSTLTSVHGMTNNREMDMNGDGFLDLPKNPFHINVMHRWKYFHKQKWRTQFGFDYSQTRLEGGLSSAYQEDSIYNADYRYDQESRRIAAFWKMGRLWDKWSIGFQNRFYFHDREAFFGDNNQALYSTRNYSGQEMFGESKLILEHFWNTTANGEDLHSHTLKFGGGLLVDSLQEAVLGVNPLQQERWEFNPYGFTEYTYEFNTSFAWIAGMRVEHHNLYGLYLLPRMNMRWTTPNEWIIKLSAGRSARSPFILTESFGRFASGRQFLVDSAFIDNTYDERAWTYGINLFKNFEIGNTSWEWVMDAYRTEFQRHTVFNIEDPSTLKIQMLQGRAFSNSFQIDLVTNWLDNLKTSVSIKGDQTFTTYDGILLRDPFVPKWVLLQNIAYNLPSEKLRADFTLTLRGPSRLPSTDNRRPESSPTFATINAQVTYAPNIGHELYIGGENLNVFRQANPIIRPDGIAQTDSNSPATLFDASMIWGPIFGPRLYLGYRYTLFRHDS